MGSVAGLTSQGTGAVGVGYEAGRTGQGEFAIAIGYEAGATGQGDNTIILNASGSNLSTTATNAFFVKRIRAQALGALPSGALHYDITSGEIMYVP